MQGPSRLLRADADRVPPREPGRLHAMAAQLAVERSLEALESSVAAGVHAGAAPVVAMELQLEQPRPSLVARGYAVRRTVPRVGS